LALVLRPLFSGSPPFAAPPGACTVAASMA
jgi:hypothetical protein